MPDIVEVLQRQSPEMRWIRWLMPDELGVLEQTLRKLRRAGLAIRHLHGYRTREDATQKQCTSRPGRRRWVPGTCNRPCGVAPFSMNRSRHRQAREPRRCR